MDLQLVRLIARRSSPPAALVAVAGLTALAAVGQPDRTDIAGVSPLFEGAVTGTSGLSASTAWLVGLLLASPLLLVQAARIPDRWFRAEGDWLGVSPAPRSSIVRSSLAGLALGAAALAAAAGVGAAGVGANPARAAAPGGGALLERAVVAGPSRSFVLMPGDTFEQALPPGSFVEGDRVRVRVTPTLGGAGPTTSARLVLGDRIEEVLIARRTWVELEASAGRTEVRLTNTGEGALAILGPRPVEVWRPSGALVGGHLRMAAHVALHLLFLGALALGLGAWMGPGIAGALAAALWLGLRMGLDGPGTGEWLPGGAALGSGLAALGEGRSPSPVAGGVLAAAGAAVLLGFALTRAALSAWRRDSRGT